MEPLLGLFLGLIGLVYIEWRFGCRISDHNFENDICKKCGIRRRRAKK